VRRAIPGGRVRFPSASATADVLASADPPDPMPSHPPTPLRGFPGGFDSRPPPLYATTSLVPPRDNRHGTTATIWFVIMNDTSLRGYVRSVKVAAIAAVTLISVVCIFQTVLAFGAPLGKAAWGGRHQGVLPKGLRIASGVAGFIVYPLIGVAVLDAAMLFESRFVPGDDKAVMWGFAVLFAVGALANLASRSTIERWWAPVSLTIALCCAVVASSL
jgi:hypothetical protein